MQGTNCPVCAGVDSNPLVERKGVPVLQHAVYRSVAEARAATRGELAMRLCGTCGFLWNAAFNEELIRYTAGYENCQSHSNAFRNHIDDRIDRIGQALPSDRAISIVEVGCGQGDFLARLVERLGAERVAAAYGFDPAWRGSDGDGPRGTKLYRGLFDGAAVRAIGLAADALITRHTIEHVPDPLAFLRNIREALTDALIFIETPCNRWIQEHRALQDFFFEHCSIFDAGSLSRAMTTCGFVPTRIERVFGDQYLWAEAITKDPSPCGLQEDERMFREKWRNTVIEARQHGPVSVWGAGAKGTTFLLLIDPDGRLTDCVIDVNPRKQGGFVPATGHEIISPVEAAAREVASVIIMNPNYRDEIVAITQSLGWSPLVYALD